MAAPAFRIGNGFSSLMANYPPPKPTAVPSPAPLAAFFPLLAAFGLLDGADDLGFDLRDDALDNREGDATRCLPIEGVALAVLRSRATGLCNA